VMASAWKLGGPGAVIIVFAAGAALGRVDSFDVVLDRTLATAFGAAIAWVVCALTDTWRDQAPATVPVPQAAPLRNQLIAGGRIALGAAAAALIAHAAGWQHPSWA